MAASSVTRFLPNEARIARAANSPRTKKHKFLLQVEIINLRMRKSRAGNTQTASDLLQRKAPPTLPMRQQELRRCEVCQAWKALPHERALLAGCGRDVFGRSALGIKEAPVQIVEEIRLNFILGWSEISFPIAIHFLVKH